MFRENYGVQNSVRAQMRVSPASQGFFAAQWEFPLLQNICR